MREVLNPWQKRRLCEHGRTSGSAGTIGYCQYFKNIIEFYQLHSEFS